LVEVFGADVDPHLARPRPRPIADPPQLRTDALGVEPRRDNPRVERPVGVRQVDHLTLSRRNEVTLASGMERRIFGLENEYGVTCTLRGQRRLSPDEVARYLFR